MRYVGGGVHDGLDLIRAARHTVGQHFDAVVGHDHRIFDPYVE